MRRQIIKELESEDVGTRKFRTIDEDGVIDTWAFMVVGNYIYHVSIKTPYAMSRMGRNAEETIREVMEN